MTNLDALLEKRGILAVAQSAGWKPYTITRNDGQFTGWSYPVYNAAGQPYSQQRWKNANGTGPKYWWPHKKPENAKYYFLPGFMSAVQSSGGIAYCAGGEPNVLAFHAAGLPNAFCWMDGEGSVPKSLPKDLAYMGVKTLFYPADRDHAGMASAHAVQEMLSGSNIDLYLLQLPGEMGSKYDVNDYWIELGFNATEFKELWALPEIDPVELHLDSRLSLGKKEGAYSEIASQVKGWRNEWIKLIVSALGSPVTHEGNVDRWRCPLPEHDDTHPSFRIAAELNADFPWPMCSCGIQNQDKPWEQVAGAVGVEAWGDFKARKAADSGYQQKPSKQLPLSQAPNSSEQIAPLKPLYIENVDMYQRVKDELLDRCKPASVPIRFPLNVLRKFGGFAKYMWAKKVVAITGISGGGKTLLMMTMMIKLMQRGHDVIWWGPEWDPYEYALQDLQRVGGLNFEQMADLQAYKALKEAGAPPEEFADIVVPSDTAIKRSILLLDDLMNMTGRMIFIPDVEAPIDDVLAIVKAITAVKRQEGRKVATLCWDYAQLAQLTGVRDWRWVEHIVGKIKTTCVAESLVGFVSSQVRKDDSEKTHDGKGLTQASAQGLSDAQFNLYLTLTPHFEGEVMLDLATLGVAKNSMGRRGKVVIPTDFAHLTVLDQEVKTLTEVVNEEMVPLNLGGGF